MKTKFKINYLKNQLVFIKYRLFGNDFKKSLFLKDDFFKINFYQIDTYPQSYLKSILLIKKIYLKYCYHISLKNLNGKDNISIGINERYINNLINSTNEFTNIPHIEKGFYFYEENMNIFNYTNEYLLFKFLIFSKRNKTNITKENLEKIKLDLNSEFLIKFIKDSLLQICITKDFNTIIYPIINKIINKINLLIINKKERSICHFNELKINLERFIINTNNILNQLSIIKYNITANHEDELYFYNFIKEISNELELNLTISHDINEVKSQDFYYFLNKLQEEIIQLMRDISKYYNNLININFRMEKIEMEIILLKGFLYSNSIIIENKIDNKGLLITNTINSVYLVYNNLVDIFNHILIFKINSNEQN